MAGTMKWRAGIKKNPNNLSQKRETYLIFWQLFWCWYSVSFDCMKISIKAKCMKIVFFLVWNAWNIDLRKKTTVFVNWKCILFWKSMNNFLSSVRVSLRVECILGIVYSDFSGQYSLFRCFGTVFNQNSPDSSRGIDTGL
jgi:hypothetical protein